jgi:hypothetical protein
VTINSNVSGSYFRSASGSVIMSGQVVGGVGSNVVLRSNGYIDLTPGFRAIADPGSKFLGYLGPCDSGMPPVYGPQQGDSLSWEGAEFRLDRYAGTLQVDGTGSTRDITIRQFEEGPVRILQTTEQGMLLNEIARYEGTEGTLARTLNTSEWKPGFYYLYLVINGKVAHLHEVEVN